LITLKRLSTKGLYTRRTILAVVEYAGYDILGGQEHELLALRRRG
jgi:hypothetical protein